MIEPEAMNAQRLEEFRVFLLIRCAQARLDGIIPSLLELSAKLAGFDCNEQNVLVELHYLTDKKLLSEVEETLSKGQIKVRISADGRDYLEKHGFPSM